MSQYGIKMNMAATIDDDGKASVGLTMSDSDGFKVDRKAEGSDVASLITTLADGAVKEYREQYAKRSDESRKAEEAKRKAEEAKRSDLRRQIDQAKAKVDVLQRQLDDLGDEPVRHDQRPRRDDIFDTYQALRHFFL